MSNKFYLCLPELKKMFETTNFHDLFEEFHQKKILIIGDVMIDTYLWGNVGRVSPEAPVPIVSGVIEENRLGEPPMWHSMSRPWVRSPYCVR